MNFDKAFMGLPRLVQIILLLIPLVGWITEILVRVSAILNKKDVLTIVGLILAICVPIFSWVDLVWCLLFKKLCLQ